MMVDGLFQIAYSVQVETIAVQAGTFKSFTLAMTKDEKFKGSFSVAGGSGNDIDFWVTDPVGNQIISERRVQSGMSFDFTAEREGAYSLNFDNGMSVISDKLVHLSYDIEKPVGGGCLIATATFGSELAPQVQQLRDLRDNTILKTSSGSRFMTAFNSVYYSFSPTIADWERQNPIFKEAVKITITPMLSTLSILNHVNIHSEAEMLGYGIGVILLNMGMYFVAPAFVIIKIHSKLSKY